MARKKMTIEEARRFAHREIAHLLENHFQLTAEAKPMVGPGFFDIEPNGPKVLAAIVSIAEQHARYGPKATDLSPAAAVVHTTPLLDAALPE
jgi:hypothetical protein